MIHARGQLEGSGAMLGVRTPAAAYLYFYYYAPVPRTVSLRGAPQT